MNISSILNLSLQTDASWNDISVALGILEKYASNLLRPEDNRPKGWDSIMLKNDVFVKRVDPVVVSQHHT